MGKACFVCICSFKRDEAEGPSHQVKGSLEERFAVVIGGKRPDDHGVAPSVESPWLVGFPFFFGLVLRSCGMLFLLGAFCSSSSSQRWNSIVTASTYRLQSLQVGQVQILHDSVPLIVSQARSRQMAIASRCNVSLQYSFCIEEFTL
jgi:hypothetical protein